MLKALELDSWVKTTGGRGLHVVMPIKRARDWSDCLEFSRGVSQAIKRTDPYLYTTAFAKAGRERKIPIDYLRNKRTNTSVFAFSPRARPGAIVSTPLGWWDLRSAPEGWTVLTGVSTREDAAQVDVPPDRIFEDLPALQAAIEAAE